MTCLLLNLSGEHLLQLDLMLRRHVHHWVTSSAAHMWKVPGHDVVVPRDEGNCVLKPDGQAGGPVVLLSDVSAVTEDSVSPQANDR
jgi:hypothetical protein